TPIYGTHATPTIIPGCRPPRDSASARGRLTPRDRLYIDTAREQIAPDRPYPHDRQGAEPGGRILRGWRLGILHAAAFPPGRLTCRLAPARRRPGAVLSRAGWRAAPSNPRRTAKDGGAASRLPRTNEESTRL